MILNIKVNLFVMLMALLFISCVDKKACKIYVQNLEIIKERLDNKQGQNLMQVDAAITFLEKLTSIRSESNGNYVGRFDPTTHDYDQWLKWFKINNSKIYWDEKDQKVKVKDQLNAVKN